MLLDPLPGARDPGRIVALETTDASGSWTPTSWLDYVDFRKYLRSFSGLAAAYPMSVALGESDNAERRRAELVSANFFDVLGVSPGLGRFFPSTQDEAAGAHPEAVIAYDYWQARWHGDAAVIGSVIQVNGFPFTVIGVAPPAFHGSMPAERIVALGAGVHARPAAADERVVAPRPRHENVSRSRAPRRRRDDRRGAR